MRALKLIPLVWLLISLLFSIYTQAQYPVGQETGEPHYIVGYEYAFNQGEGQTYVPVTPTQDYNLLTDIDVSALTNNVNIFRIRFKDDLGKWSSTLTKLFIKPVQADTGTDTKIVGYEYAFNQGEGQTYVPVTPTQDYNLLTDIDVSALTNNVNIFRIRFKDDRGKWSSTLTKLFIKPVQADTGTDTKIVGYEYAFNQGEGQTYVPITPTNDYNLLTDIDVSALTDNVNIFRIRFKDDRGKWSSVLTKLFIKPVQADTGMDTKIVGYEYAFNQGEGQTYVPITPTNDYNLLTDIDVSALTNNVNIFRIRFKDDRGKWSSTLTKLFIKPPSSDSLTDNKLVSYAYWFDNDITTKRQIDIDPEVTDLLVQELDMTYIWRGEHHLQSQFKDIYGKYSLVMTDTIVKTPFPIAAFDVDNTGVCLGESVNFTDAGSIDYDTITYDFGDGTTSTELNVSHTYTATGVYDASLTVVDTETGLDSVLVKSITVRDYPSNGIHISGEIPACFGDIITLTADEEDAVYLWSNGEETQSISVTEPGDYYVEVSLDSPPSCTVQSNTINVSFYPEIDNSISLQDYPLLLTANQTNATYQWVDCTNGNMPIEGATNVSFEPTVNGEYAVEITQNGCTISSDCITIGSVAIADYAIKQLVHLYPNPVLDELQLESEVPISIQVYNSNGKIILIKNVIHTIDSIDFSQLSSGLYFVRVRILSGVWENKSTLFKLIKL